MPEGLTITSETARSLRMIADAPNDVDALVEATDLDPKDFARFLAAVGASHKPAARELLRAAKTRYKREGRHSAARPNVYAERPRLQQAYELFVRHALQEQFGFLNPMQVPKLERIHVTVPVPGHDHGSASISAAAASLALISGQKPVGITPRHSIPDLGIRAGHPIAVEVTLRRKRMWDFLDRLINLALPQVPGFNGLPRRSFDGHGNYHISVKEHSVFPEIDQARLEQVFPVGITFVTSSTENELAYALLHRLGMPFADEPVFRAAGRT